MRRTLKSRVASFSVKCGTAPSTRAATFVNLTDSSCVFSRSVHPYLHGEHDFLFHLTFDFFFYVKSILIHSKRQKCRFDNFCLSDFTWNQFWWMSKMAFFDNLKESAFYFCAYFTKMLGRNFTLSIFFYLDFTWK